MFRKQLFPLLLLASSCFVASSKSVEDFRKLPQRCAICCGAQPATAAAERSQMPAWAAEARRRAQTYGAHRFETSASQHAVIDYLVVYDATGRNYAQSHAGSMAEHAQLVVNAMNEVLRNSKIDAEFRLAGTMFTERSVASVGAGIDVLFADATVAAQRKATHADIVVLLSEPVYDDGISGTAMQEAQASAAFCSVRASMATSGTAIHEAGHVVGCQHSRIQAGDAGDHPYAVGTGNAPYYTIMTTMPEDPEMTQQAPIFSGTESVWKGVKLGSPTEDNVRKFRERMHEVAAFGDEQQHYTLSQQQWAVTNDAQQLNLRIYADEGYWIKTTASWLSVSADRGFSTTQLQISVAPNYTGAERHAFVVVYGASGYPDAYALVVQNAEGRITRNYPLPNDTSASAAETKTHEVLLLSSANGLGYAAFCPEQPLRLPDGLSAAYLRQNAQGQLELVPCFGGALGAVLPAGAAVVLYGAPGKYQLAESQEAVSVSPTMAAENLLHSAAGAGAVEASKGHYVYKFSQHEGALGFFFQEGTDGLRLDNAAETSYLELSIARASALGYDLAALGTTAVFSVLQNKDVPMPTYDLSGRKSTTGQRVLLIVGGKKIWR